MTTSETRYAQMIEATLIQLFGQSGIRGGRLLCRQLAGLLEEANLPISVRVGGCSVVGIMEAGLQGKLELTCPEYAKYVLAYSKKVGFPYNSGAILLNKIGELLNPSASKDQETQPYPRTTYPLGGEGS